MKIKRIIPVLVLALLPLAAPAQDAWDGLCSAGERVAAAAYCQGGMQVRAAQHSVY